MARVLGTTVEDLRQYDTRPPVDEIKRLATSNPKFGLAFRKVVDRKVSPEALLKLAEEQRRKREK